MVTNGPFKKEMFNTRYKDLSGRKPFAANFSHKLVRTGTSHGIDRERAKAIDEGHGSKLWA